MSMIDIARHLQSFSTMYKSMKLSTNNGSKVQCNEMKFNKS